VTANALREDLETCLSAGMILTAHAFKGSGAQLGTHRLAETCQDLETRGHRMEWPGVEEIVNHFQSEIDRIAPLLRARATPSRPPLRRSHTEHAGWAPPVSPKAVNASEELLGQRDDDARRASHVAESVLVLVLGHLADELGAVGAQASDSVVDAFDCKHDAPEAQRVWRCDRRFDLDQFWIANFVSSSRPCPSGVRIITMSTWKLSSPLTRSTHGPSIGALPSIVMPSSVKNSIAAARSSTTTLTWSNLLIVMSRI
jgi:HPt (histidine-containing phosphotransfer) domain-containing protein